MMSKLREDWLWFFLLAVFSSLTILMALNAWSFISYPIVLDSFWNPTLKMWEPVYATQITGWWRILPFIAAFYTSSPWYVTYFWGASILLIVVKVLGRKSGL